MDKGASKGLAAANEQQQENNRRVAIDELYKIYDELSAATDKSMLEDEYKTLLRATHNGEKEKGLASQFITRFAEYFPKLEMKTANALFDLCEDDDVAMRKQAEKDLVTVCKKLPTLVSTVADVFAQILQTDNSGELNIVHNSLMSLFYTNPAAAITGIFAQIQTGPPIVKDRCYQFLESKYKSLGPEVRSPEFEQRLFEIIPKVLRAVETREQFLITVDILNSTKIAQTVHGRRAIVEMIEFMLDIKKNFCASGTEDIAKLLVITDFVFQFFHEDITSASLFTYFCTHVLPKIKHVAENDYYSVLKITVELRPYIGKMAVEQVELCLEALLTLLDEFLIEARKNEKMLPSYNFSFIECIMYLIHRLGCSQPMLLVGMMKSRELLRSKIGYLLRVAVTYKFKIRTELQLLPVPERATKRDKLTCLLTMINIAALGKVLYNAESPVAEKMRLSWKIKDVLSLSACSSPVTSLPTKRRVTLVKRSRMDEVSRDNKKFQDAQPKIYQPPNGKFSGRTMSYDDEASQPRRSRGYRYENSGRSVSGMARYSIRRNIRKY